MEKRQLFLFHGALERCHGANPEKPSTMGPLGDEVSQAPFKCPHLRVQIPLCVPSSLAFL